MNDVNKKVYSAMKVSQLGMLVDLTQNMNVGRYTDAGFAGANMLMIMAPGGGMAN
ncbi:MAG: hypothetical protein KME13_03160 [Myxacorys californica WJT36-NPBG1]|jgi:hypothetical protein|nr:hypothetical protein [Myxacorys californica WJT36-NPBG1]